MAGNRGEILLAHFDEWMLRWCPNPQIRLTENQEAGADENKMVAK